MNSSRRFFSLKYFPFIAILMIAGICFSGTGIKDTVPGFSNIDQSNDDFKVLKEDCSRLYYDFLLNVAQEQFDNRRKVVSEVYKNIEEVKKYQAKIKDKLTCLTNSFPEKTPLNAKVTGVIVCGNYRIEKIIFESRPNLYVSGNLYIPNIKKEPFPAVLEACGHAADGKASEKYQSAAILLAKNGFVSFVIDTYSQGERSSVNHTQIDIGAMLVGTDLVAYQAWDNIRAIDYLYSRPEVDKSRIGITGNSGGGTQSWYMMAIDNRIKAAAPSCGLQTRERMFTLNGMADGCHNFANEGLNMLEYADYLISFAPKPVLILAAENDRFFDINAVAKTVRETKWFYKELGALDRVDLFTVDEGHGFHQGLREAATWWFKKWLMNDAGIVIEPELTIQPVEKLWATKTGEVLTEINNSKSIIDINIQQAKDLGKNRRVFWKDNSKQECIAKVIELINYQDKKDNKEIMCINVGDITKNGINIRKLHLTGRDGFPIPVLMYIPANKKGPLPVTIYLDPEGKGNVFDTDSIIEIIGRNDRIVFAVDLRGFGETSVDLDGLRKNWHNWNEQHLLSQTALYVGHPLMGQRVQDVIDIVDYLYSNPVINNQDIELVGIGHCGPVALHATAIDSRITHVKVFRSITSFMDIICEPEAKHQFKNVVFGAMKYYDFSDLVNAIAPRHVEIIEPVDAYGNLIDSVELINKEFNNY